MPNYIYREIAGAINLLPIRSLSVYLNSTTDYIAFEQLEKESSYNITPITKSNSLGETITLGYKIEVTCYLPYNLYHNNNLISHINLINENPDNSGILRLGNSSDIAYTQPEIINSTASMRIIINNIKLSFEIESVELRPRMILKFSKIIKTSEIENIFYN